MKGFIHLCFLGIAVSTCFITVNKGIAGPLPHRSRTDITPMSLLQDLKNGTRTKAQLKTALLEYMKKEAGKTEDNVTRYTPEAGRNKNVITYVGFEKDWAVINKRSLAVLRETLPKLQSQDSSIRLEGLDDLTNLMLAFEITTTPEKKQNKALRLLLGHFYFSPAFISRRSAPSPIFRNACCASVLSMLPTFLIWERSSIPSALRHTSVF